MERLSGKLAAYLYSHMDSPEMSMEMYRYSFQVMLEMLSGILASICIALYLNMVLESFVFLVIFSVLRSYAGGLHLKWFGSCLLCSTMITVAVLLSVKFYSISLAASGIMLGAVMMLLLNIPAVANENRTVTEDESAYFRTKLIQALLGVGIFFLFTVIVGNERYAFLISLTVTVAAVLMLMGRWKDECEKLRLK